MSNPSHEPPVISTALRSDLPFPNDPHAFFAPTVSLSPAKPIPRPKHHLSAPVLSRIPISRSQSSYTSSSSDSSSEEGPSRHSPPPFQDTSDARSDPKSTGVKTAPRPQMVIPLDPPDPPGISESGAYVHLVKERLMGIFLSIYIHKGCEHLVQGLSYHFFASLMSKLTVLGVDTDFVTAGLAGGRLGNKGGM